jgi:sec-independent protein translocase protein TatA
MSSRLREGTTVMPNVGPMELIIVLVIALIVLGPKRLPDFGRSLGKGMREFKDSISGVADDRDEDDEDDVAQLHTTQATKPS